MPHGVPNLTEACQTTYEGRRMKIAIEIRDFEGWQHRLRPHRHSERPTTPMARLFMKERACPLQSLRAKRSNLSVSLAFLPFCFL
jgi:hypothetical protein